ncbi:AAA family ATPase [Paracoccus sp. MC1862]|uniref:AAA family ATPase n=1 Tax=Paracoccus sp. MC1862 TaxID=2760307 RepID=UPI0015FF1C0F|nr:AAA family ATPase [Paracoccus sp. MC1862]MBB1497532.1 AAA family ATPase [Paracoccus sp. MC1862]QQO46003.1 AAA family ATPase [Paracoccus sp. MC1862]
MQILAIRGENLASLAERFEIDLTAEPLRSAGLFAITGETGAGKSTILDAMCLALFDDCPRLNGGGVDDEVPDISGVAVRSKDSKGILRRGASLGWAEVDFIGLDSEHYRAYWAARRAHNRADGRLQNVDRRLTRLSDDQVLSTQLTTVNNEVVRLGGRTFEEFRRTVLLAQGDFDAFLRAGTAERAATLEKVTGTEIYRTISRTVYDRAAAAKAALETLEARRGERKVLSDEERAGLAAENAELSAALQADQEQLAGVQADLRRHAEIETARQRRDAATSAAEAALQAQAGAAADRARLEEIDKGLPLRDRNDAVAQCRRDAAGAEATLKQADIDLTKAQDDLQAAQSAKEAASKAHDEAEAGFKGFGPVWTEASRLDSAIETAALELAEAERLEGAAKAEQQSRSATLRSLGEEEKAARSNRDAAISKLKDMAGIEPVAASWTDISDCFGRRNAQRVEREAAEAALEEQKKRQQKAADEHTLLQEKDREDLAAIQLHDERISELTTEIEEIEKAEPAQEDGRLGRAGDHLAGMLREARDLQRASGEAATAAAQQKDALALAGAEAARLEQIKEKGLKAAGAVEALRKPLERAEDAASAAAAQMRAGLEQGEPCPVCGGTEHPFLADPGRAAAAEALRLEMQAARKAHEDAKQEYVEAGRAKAEHEARAAQARNAVVAAESRAETARKALAAAADKLATMDAGIAEPGDGWTIQAIEALQASISARRSELQEAIRKSTRLRRSSDGERRTRDVLAAGRDKRAVSMAQLARDIADAERQIAVQEEKIGQAGMIIAGLDDRLAPCLDVLGLEAPSLDDPQPGSRKG